MKKKEKYVLTEFEEHCLIRYQMHNPNCPAWVSDFEKASVDLEEYGFKGRYALKRYNGEPYWGSFGSWLQHRLHVIDAHKRALKKMAAKIYENCKQMGMGDFLA